ncbi:hypothetical protein M3Y95_01192300 [Aphelenchoides besseyi]|nr:hypothetical protein M3Y95_01192300 [Aphelenchoides besseyi]
MEVEKVLLLMLVNTIMFTFMLGCSQFKSSETDDVDGGGDRRKKRKNRKRKFMGFNKKQEIEKTQRLSLHGTVDEEDRKQPRSRGNDDLLPKPPPQMPTAAQIPILKIQREKTKELDITQPLTEGKPKPIGHQKRTSTSSKKKKRRKGDTADYPAVSIDQNLKPTQEDEPKQLATAEKNVTLDQTQEQLPTRDGAEVVPKKRKGGEKSREIALVTAEEQPKGAAKSSSKPKNRRTVEETQASEEQPK